MEETWLRFGAVLLNLALGVLNLCRAQGNLKTIKNSRGKYTAQCYKVLCQSQVIITLDYSEVIYELCSESCRISIENAETCSLEKHFSNLRQLE